MKFAFSRLLVFTIATTLLISQAAAQIVEIPDPNLRQAIRETLELPPNAPVTQQEMLKLQRLHAPSKGIADLTGLEYATNLQNLSAWANPISNLIPLSNLTQLKSIDLGGCQIIDVTPLANLQLEWLSLNGNQIVNVSPLANLTQLKELWIKDNQIVNVIPLADLIQLEVLSLDGNQIVDVSPLANLTRLKRLTIERNPIIDFSPLDELPLEFLERDEVCELPALPIQERLENRTFPSVFSAWTGFRLPNKLELSKIGRWTLHDLHWHLPYFKTDWLETSQEWNIYGNLGEAQAMRDELLSLNPNMLFLIEVRVRDDFLSQRGEDYPYWLRDSEGNLVRDTGDIYLTDFTQPAMQDMIVQQAIAVAKCGLFDGIFLDRFAEGARTLYEEEYPHKRFYNLEEEQRAKDNIIQRIRAAVREDFLIIANYNREKIRRRAWGINGSFMETLRDNDRGYTHDGIKQIENTLLWLEENLRPPQINCLEGWGIPTEPPDSPNNLRWMRLFTTMSLTLSDGYVLYGMEDSHQHIWYSFWDTDLGYPIGPKAQPYQNIEGLFIREFTNGWAVYNRSGNPQTITLPRISTGVSSNKQDITHLLPDLDGEIYLRKGKPFDLNSDGAVNVLDLLLVSQHFGTTAGDVNGDSTTNILDLILVAQQFNQ